MAQLSLEAQSCRRSRRPDTARSCVVLLGLPHQSSGLGGTFVPGLPGDSAVIDRARRCPAAPEPGIEPITTGSAQVPPRPDSEREISRAGSLRVPIRSSTYWIPTQIGYQFEYSPALNPARAAATVGGHGGLLARPPRSLSPQSTGPREDREYRINLFRRSPRRRLTKERSRPSGGSALFCLERRPSTAVR